MAERFLDSIEQHVFPGDTTIEFVGVVWFHGDPNIAHKDRPWNVEWLYEYTPQGFAVAKHRAVLAVISEGVDLVWLADDDNICIPDTHLHEVIDLALRPGVGYVTFSRKIRKTHVPKPKDICTPLVYLAAGALFKPDAYLEAGGIPNTVSDEPAASINMYLLGYNNYRTRRVFVYHDQGNTGGGGLHKTLEEGIVIPPSDFHRNHPLVQAERVDGRYGSKKLVGQITNARITDKARAIHTKNRKARGWS